jgi:galactonate dehydratase
VKLELSGSSYVVPDAPGLGVEVDEDRLKAAAFQYSEAPHLRRRDGSFTNW